MPTRFSDHAIGAAESIANYCSTRFPTDTPPEPTIDLPWFAEKVQKAIDAALAERGHWGNPNPEGWYTVPVEVVTNGAEIMFLGPPPDEEADPKSEVHHCDSVGCGFDHVLLRQPLSMEDLTNLAHLISERPPQSSPRR